jgi:hypothetical protein
MTSTLSSSTAHDQVVKKHPIRGALWGLLLGCSLAVYAVLFSVVVFGDWLPLVLIVLAGAAIGVGWAFVAPAKQPKGDPPAPAKIAQDAPPDPEPEPEADPEPVSDIEPTADDD